MYIHLKQVIVLSALVACEIVNIGLPDLVSIALILCDYKDDIN